MWTLKLQRNYALVKCNPELLNLNFTKITTLQNTVKGLHPALMGWGCAASSGLDSAVVSVECICFRFQSLVDLYSKMYPAININVSEELTRYRELADVIRPMVGDTIDAVHKALKDNKFILCEGANAAMLDIDFGRWGLHNM